MLALTHALVALTLAAAPTPPVAGDAPTAALVVERDPATAECPDAAALQALVASRLGRDPFDPLAQRKAAVRFQRVRQRFVAELRVREPNGREGRRTLTEPRCEALAESLALALAVAIDPMRQMGPTDPGSRVVRPAWAVRPAEPDPVAMPRRELEPPRPPPRPPLVKTWRWGLGLGVNATAGLGPSLLLGPTLRLAARPPRRNLWRFGLELAFLGAPTATVAAVRVETRAIGLAASACHGFGIWSACGGATLRAWSVEATDGVAVPVSDTRWIASLDLGLGIAAGRATAIALSLGLPLPRPVLLLDGREVWRASPLTVSLSVRLTLGAGAEP